jgi:hypothetical protein
MCQAHNRNKVAMQRNGEAMPIQQSGTCAKHEDLEMSSLTVAVKPAQSSVSTITLAQIASGIKALDIHADQDKDNAKWKQYFAICSIAVQMGYSVDNVGLKVFGKPIKGERDADHFRRAYAKAKEAQLPITDQEWVAILQMPYAEAKLCVIGALNQHLRFLQVNNQHDYFLRCTAKNDEQLKNINADIDAEKAKKEADKAKKAKPDPVQEAKAQQQAATVQDVDVVTLALQAMATAAADEMAQLAGAMVGKLHDDGHHDILIAMRDQLDAIVANMAKPIRKAA